MIEVMEYRSSFGELLIGVFEGEVCLCDWKYRRMRSAIDRRIQNEIGVGYIEIQGNKLIAEVIRQLESYFKGDLKEFDVPLRFCGTAFQIDVWNGLLKVPYGETMSYSELASMISRFGSTRAVATANGANAISILVPCHRIIGSDGELRGYAGGLRIKKKLIELESEQKDLFSGV